MAKKRNHTRRKRPVNAFAVVADMAARRRARRLHPAIAAIIKDMDARLANLPVTNGALDDAVRFGTGIERVHVPLADALKPAAAINECAKTTPTSLLISAQADVNGLISRIDALVDLLVGTCPVGDTKAAGPQGAGLMHEIADRAASISEATRRAHEALDRLNIILP